jgi:hypothetical protein
LNLVPLCATHRRENDELRAEVERLIEQGGDVAIEVAQLEVTVERLTSENEHLRAALKIHHDLGLWTAGHGVCPECGQACRT